MNDLEEFESWYEDLTAWERYQDELDRINESDEFNDDIEMEDEEKSSSPPIRQED